MDPGSAMAGTSTLCLLQGHLFPVRRSFVCSLYQSNMPREQNDNFISQTTTFPTGPVSTGGGHLLSTSLAFPSPNQGSLVKRDSVIPTTTPSAAKAPYSPSSWPFTSILFCTTLPDSEKNQSFTLSGTYTLPWITVTHTLTPAPSSSSDARLIQPNMSFLFITFLFGVL